MRNLSDKSDIGGANVKAHYAEIFFYKNSFLNYIIFIVHISRSLDDDGLQRKNSSEKTRAKKN